MLLRTTRYNSISVGQFIKIVLYIPYPKVCSILKLCSVIRLLTKNNLATFFGKSAVVQFNKLLFQINLSVFLQRKTKKTKKGVERGQPLILNIGPQNIFRYIGK